MPLHAWSSTCITTGTDVLALYKPWLCCSNVWAVSCITAPWPRVSSCSLTVLLEINDKKRSVPAKAWKSPLSRNYLEDAWKFRLTSSFKRVIRGTRWTAASKVLSWHRFLLWTPGVSSCYSCGTCTALQKEDYRYAICVQTNPVCPLMLYRTPLAPCNES